LFVFGVFFAERVFGAAREPAPIRRAERRQRHLRRGALERRRGDARLARAPLRRSRGERGVVPRGETTQPRAARLLGARGRLRGRLRRRLNAEFGIGPRRVRRALFFGRGVGSFASRRASGPDNVSRALTTAPVSLTAQTPLAKSKSYLTRALADATAHATRSGAAAPPRSAASNASAHRLGSAFLFNSSHMGARGRARG